LVQNGPVLSAYQLASLLKTNKTKQNLFLSELLEYRYLAGITELVPGV